MMKKRSILASLLVGALALSSCAVVNPSKEEPDYTHDWFAGEQESQQQQWLDEARLQYEDSDYTRLAEPVHYKMLWLGYTKATYKDLDFRMTAFDQEYLQAVVLNFEKTVERIADGNLDIEITFGIKEETVSLTKDETEDWLYLAQSTVQADIDSYSTDGPFDGIITTVQTAGKENENRNQSSTNYGVHTVMLGLNTAGINNEIGYSTFDLGIPAEGTFPLADPAVPSLYATAVAVHEWMHQFEAIGEWMGVEFPPTHAYQGPSVYSGYQAYEADKNNYDYFEFYELVLSGRLPFTDEAGEIKYIGMYPKMWKLITQEFKALNAVGGFTIESVGGGYLSFLEQQLSLSDSPCVWMISAGGEGFYILSPKEAPNLRIDLNNAWDAEGNTVGLHEATDYKDAQRWDLSKNSDGTYCIKTAYGSGNGIRVEKIEEGAILSSTGGQWIFKKVE